MSLQRTLRVCSKRIHLTSDFLTNFNTGPERLPTHPSLFDFYQIRNLYARLRTSNDLMYFISDPLMNLDGARTLSNRRMCILFLTRPRIRNQLSDVLTDLFTGILTSQRMYTKRQGFPAALSTVFNCLPFTESKINFWSFEESIRKTEDFQRTSSFDLWCLKAYTRNRKDCQRTHWFVSH